MTGRTLYRLQGPGYGSESSCRLFIRPVGTCSIIKWCVWDALTYGIAPYVGQGELGPPGLG